MDQLHICGKSLSNTKANEEIYSLDNKDTHVQRAELGKGEG